MSKHIRVYIPGIFDVYNAGDILHFQQVQKQFGENCEIILGFFDENDLKSHNIPTVMTAVQRTENLKHCRLVDGVINPCPWRIEKQFLSEFNIDIVCNYQIPQEALYYDEIFGYVKQIGKLREIKCETNVNSNQIVARILADMDKGQSRHEMGISWFEEQRIRWKYAFKTFIKQLFEPCVRRLKEI